MWFNFHTHSNFCDGKGELTDYISSASEKGLTSLGFSSHAPLPFPCSWCMAPDAFAAYAERIDELEKHSPALQLYKSLEIDFIPGVVSPAQFRPLLDYTIGSIHFADAYADGKPWEIDGPHPAFLKGLADIFGNKMQHAVTRYFELTRQMISTSGPTIIGHLDKIKIQNKDEKFFRETDRWYVDEVTRTLDVIKTAGSIVEVNTRGVYQKKSATTYPSPWILERIHLRDIPVTLSSDAHHPDDLLNEFSETALMLWKIGFKKLSVLHDGAWKAFDFDENGIIVERP